MKQKNPRPKKGKRKAVIPVQVEKPPNLTPFRLQILRRQEQVFNLRRAGLGFGDISQMVVPPFKEESGARYAFNMMMRRRYFEPPEQLRQLELERLNAIQVEMWKMAQQGSLKATEVVLKILERRARLEGLDKPVQVEVGGIGGGPIRVREVIIENDAPDDNPA